MNDLISRKDVIDLIKRFVFVGYQEPNKEIREEFINYIKEIPTAFDLEGVIEELEGWKNRAKASINYYSENSSCYPCIHNKTNLQKKEYLVLKNVLRIVKSEITTNGKNGG